MIFENLISNAIKYSPAGKKIKLKVEQNDKIARCSVIDQGPGLRKQDLEVIFKKYKKLKNTPTTSQKSYGLGLSIVQKYVQEMKGKVWCESELGKGSSFIVEFDAL